jgi:ParB-like nuclease family protein
MSHPQVVANWNDYSEERVPIDSLLPADSPRLSGESLEHARVLAASEAVLPPIVVQRSTRRVIDGMHRLRAAAIRGQNDIVVRFYEGDDEDAFIVGVATNIAHGLPLSLADRTAAATRIITIRPQWSDRKIASVTGLAATTVGVIRRRSTGHPEQSNTSNRLGRDGKVRPLDRTTGRLRAGEFLKNRPDASVREIARASGVSPATALDVRNRIRGGFSPVPDGKSGTLKKVPGPRGELPRVPELPEDVDSEVVLRDLKKDPSLRFTEIGRALLRWLDIHTVGLGHWKQHADNVPAHSMQAVAKLARQNSDSWHELAQYMESLRKPTS